NINVHFIGSLIINVYQIRPNQETSVIKEEETVTLSCTYDTSSSYVYLYWYRQYPNKELRYLLFKPARSGSASGSPDDPRFQSTTSQTSTKLTITGVTLSDSALYYCITNIHSE
uniref:Ig-like domain-containing protein n=1 Tax=Sinocyclocheilus grahami TaxID=75366 RepID=A0A672PJQ1_SINGR